MNLLSRDEVCPRSNLSLSLAGTTLDPLAELQSLKGLRPGAILRLVEGIGTVIFLSVSVFIYLILIFFWEPSLLVQISNAVNEVIAF